MIGSLITFLRANRQLYLVIAILALAIGLSRTFSGLREIPKSSAQPAQLPVTVQEVHAATHRIEVKTTGKVEPRNTVSITPQVSGRIEWLNPSMYAGGYFSTDETLFSIETSDYENTVARENAEVARAQTGLALEQAEAQASLGEWRSINGTLPAPALVSHKPQIAQAQALLASAKARLAQAKLDLSRTDYTLPFAGRVLSSSLELGEYLLAGQAYGESYSTDSMEIVVSLPKSDLPWIGSPHIDSSPRPNITISFKDLGSGTNKTVAGRLIRIGATLDDTTRFQQLVIKPETEAQLLLPGMLAKITITGSPVDNSWKLPFTALQTKNSLWQVDADNRLRRLQAEVLATQGDSVIVRAPLPTARIITGTLNGGIDGAEVRIIADIPATPSALANADEEDVSE